ncbi:hypothetical protein A2U01_0062411, partial [Trifolium medium]|nr:hypothetical protein [Trifolium medium]
MIFGLTDAYVGFVTCIQQHDPLPTFAAAKSRLELEESTILQRVARDFSSTPAALVAKTPHPHQIFSLHPGTTHKPVPLYPTVIA